MAWRRKKLDYDPVLKRMTWFYHDDDDAKIKIVEEWDINDILEDNKAMYAATDERAGWKGDMHRIGSIPLSIWQDVYKKTGGGKDRKAVKKWVNDSDNRAFLTRPVRL